MEDLELIEGGQKVVGLADKLREEGKELGIELGKELGKELGIELGWSGGREEGLVLGRAEGKEEGRAEGKEEGRAEGLAEAKAEWLVSLLQDRFGRVPKSVKGRIAQASVEELDAWFDRAPTAETLAAVFEGKR